MYNRCYGGGHSLRGWQRDRLATAFESKSSAKKRNSQNSNSPVAEKKAKKSHVGRFETMDWDKEACLEEVKDYEEGAVVSWRGLATKYKVCDSNGKLASNGGQIVKEYFISRGVDISSFKSPCQRRNGKQIVRRRKRRSAGGEVSMPTDPTPEKLRGILAEKLSSGEYTVGEMIVPRKVMM